MLKQFQNENAGIIQRQTTDNKMLKQFQNENTGIIQRPIHNFHKHPT